MIPFKLQLFLVAISVLILVFFIIKIRAYKLELKYTVLWLLIISLSIIMAIFPNILLLISRLLSIEIPVNALFLFGLVACFFILYSLTSTISDYSMKIKELSQELGLLKNEIRRLKDSDKDFD
ncbi:DUF2304 domain-containing protein [Paenibacillus sp. FSL M8-0334]|uniref:DUF2304 domain-containing protein n=1 Tax=Paenibacillus sp. FSL M8-0334 TaxID=2921623 RepID=UPI004046C7DF